MNTGSQANAYWQRAYLQPGLSDQVTFDLTAVIGSHTTPTQITIQALDVNGNPLLQPSNILVRLTTGVYPLVGSTNGTITANIGAGTTLVEDLHTLVSGNPASTAVKLKSNNNGLWTFSITNTTQNQVMGLWLASCEGSLRGDFTAVGLGYGQLTSITVTAAGSAYNQTGLAPYAPVVTIAPPPLGGVQATAVATVGTSGATAGQITAITLTNPGAGYVLAPAVTISAVGSTGTGATATASITFSHA